MSLSIYVSGFAAAQCGKALPFRSFFFFLEAAPRIHEAEPPGSWMANGKAEPYRTGRRQSRRRKLTNTIVVDLLLELLATHTTSL
jgi:hypothetical protein